MRLFIIPIIFFIISIVFIPIGLIFYKRYKKDSERIRSSICVDAEVINNQKRSGMKTEDSSTTYAPVYRYYYNGYDREYISSVSYGKEKAIGTIDKINILPNGEVIQEDLIKIEKWVGIGFIVSGITTSILCLFIILALINFA